MHSNATTRSVRNPRPIFLNIPPIASASLPSSYRFILLVYLEMFQLHVNIRHKCLAFFSQVSISYDTVGQLSLWIYDFNLKIYLHSQLYMSSLSICLSLILKQKRTNTLMIPLEQVRQTILYKSNKLCLIAKCLII